ncbi:MAG: holin [Aeriscardovia sp.]|nr:holin [Aeriscardovia sp.]
MKGFWKYALIRALRTIAQTAVSTIAVFSTGEIVGIADINWVLVASASVLAGILSMLTSIATGLPEVEYEQHLYMSHDEPEDAEVDEDD